MTDEGFSLDKEILAYLSEHPGETANAITNFIKLEFGRFDVKYVRQRIEGLVNAGKVSIKINTRAPTQAPLLFVAESKPATVEPVKVEKKTGSPRTTFTPKQLRHIKGRYGFDSIDQIARDIGSTYEAVSNKLQKLTREGQVAHKVRGHLNVAQTAAALGLSERQVKSLIQTKEIPAKRMHWHGPNGMYFVLKEDIGAYKQLGKPPAPEPKQATLDTPAPVVKTPPVIVRLPWERQPEETTKAYGAFCIHRDTPPNRRNLRKLAVSVGHSVRGIQNWSSKNEWMLRCQAWDDHRAQIAVKAIEHESRKPAAASSPIKPRSKPNKGGVPENKYGPWTAEDDAIILDLYRTTPAREIAEIVNRTRSAIHGRIHYLHHLPKSQEIPESQPEPATIEEPIQALDEFIEEFEASRTHSEADIGAAFEVEHTSEKLDAAPATEPEPIQRMPWDRQLNETDRAYAAFCIYRSRVPEGRDLSQISALLYNGNEKVGSVWTWFREHHWQPRVSAWDKHMARMFKVTFAAPEKPTLDTLNKNKRWSDEEIQYVLGNAEEKSVRSIAKDLGRTPLAVKKQIKNEAESKTPHIVRSAPSTLEEDIPEPVEPTPELTTPEELIPEVVEGIPEPVTEPAVIYPPPVAEQKSGWWQKFSKIKEILINGVKL